MGLCRASLSATPTSHVTSERVQARAHKCVQMQKGGRFVSCMYLSNFVYILYIRLPTWDKSAGTIRLENLKCLLEWASALTKRAITRRSIVWSSQRKYFQLKLMQRAEHENTNVSEQRDRQTNRLGTLPVSYAKSAILCGLAITYNRSQSAILVWVHK